MPFAGDSRDVKRLTYGLFCKALYMVAGTVLPEMPSEEAFAVLVSRVTNSTCAAATPATTTAGCGPSVGKSEEAVRRLDYDLSSEMDDPSVC